MGVASPNMEVLCPLLTIPHKITFGDVCGDPDFGTPPPLGIEFIPPKMRDILFHKGANRAFMKTPLEKV